MTISLCSLNHKCDGPIFMDTLIGNDPPEDDLAYNSDCWLGAR